MAQKTLHPCLAQKQGFRSEHSPPQKENLDTGVVFSLFPPADPGFWSEGAQWSFDPKGGGPEPKFCSKQGFFQKNCLKNAHDFETNLGGQGGARAPGPLDPLVVRHHMMKSQHPGHVQFKGS